jgi:MFS transporter, DHA1 family, inner membrane transport protein
MARYSEMPLANASPASAHSVVVQKPETSFGLILALWAAGLCAAAQFAKISLIFPELMKFYPNAGSAAGFLVSLLSFLGVALGLVTGIIVARFGYRSLLLCALVFGAAISAYQATLPPFHLMLVSRLLEGASHLIIVVAAPTLIAHVSSDRYRAAAMTLWGTFFGVAFALVAWLGLPLVSLYGPASLFIVHAIALLLVAGLLHVMLPREKHVSSDASTLSFSEIIRRHFETYRSAFIAAPAMGWLFYTLSFVSLLTLLPNYVPAGQRAFVSGAMPLASIASSMTLGVFLLRYVEATHVIVLGFMVSILCAAFLWLFPGSVLGCIALFGALGLVQGASFAAVPQLNKDDQARAYANGALAQMGNLGNLSGTPLLLLMAAGMEFHGLIVFVVICYTCGIAVHVTMFIRRQKSIRIG